MADLVPVVATSSRRGPPRLRERFAEALSVDDLTERLAVLLALPEIRVGWVAEQQHRQDVHLRGDAQDAPHLLVAAGEADPVRADTLTRSEGGT
jgi:hypothetical protein